MVEEDMQGLMRTQFVLQKMLYAQFIYEQSGSIYY